MNFSKKIYQEIWDAALPFQNKRDDEGHAQVVTNFALRLCESEKVDANIVIPAAILHDIGWSRLSDDHRFIIFKKDVTKENVFQIRRKHEIEGAKLGKIILESLNYPENLNKEIIEIISEHDTRKEFLSPDDGAVRDADKLWRYSKIGLEADKRRRGKGFGDFLDGLRAKMELPDFFYFESSRKIAKADLEKNLKVLC